MQLPVYTRYLFIYYFVHCSQLFILCPVLLLFCPHILEILLIFCCLCALCAVLLHLVVLLLELELPKGNPPKRLITFLSNLSIKSNLQTECIIVKIWISTFFSLVKFPPKTVNNVSYGVKKKSTSLITGCKLSWKGALPLAKSAVADSSRVQPISSVHSSCLFLPFPLSLKDVNVQTD